MAQANDLSTAIREIMSRRVVRHSTSAARAAHAEYIAAFAANPPHPIYQCGDSLDLDARADHIEKALAAFNVYLCAFLADTVQHIPGRSVDIEHVGNLYSDLEGEIVGALRRAAEDMRQHETWRAQ